MALDLGKLLHMHDFTHETKSLGTLYCGSVNADAHSKLREVLKAPSVDGLGFARQVLGLIAKMAPAAESKDAKAVLEQGFTNEEIIRLTNEELEFFAEDFLAHNPWILHSYDDAKRTVNTDDKGESVVTYTPKAIDLPKEDAESSSDYLVRVFRRYLEEQSKSLKRTMERLSGNAMQQSALGVIAEANRYLTENSASMAIAMHSKREQDLMRAATSPLQDAQRYLKENSVSAILAKTIYRNEDLIREAALGLAQRDTMLAGIAIGLERQQQETRDLLKSHEAMFRLPQAFEATRLLDSYNAGALAEFVQGHAKDILDRRRVLEAITTPWLHRVEVARSVTAILEMQDMGNALRTIKGFDPGLTAALRLDLGDWRDKINFPESVFIDPVARTDFYITRGFNTALTDFPEAAFHQSLGLAGLDGETFEFELYGPAGRPSADPEEEAGLQRTNKCHDRLQRFERRLRQFIDDAMTAQYGPDWPRKRLAPKLYEEWELKKQRVESSGVIVKFIEVADFTDYETIICKQDHWREIFEPRFKRKESVRESFQRLQPIRVAAMHARLVTKEDELYLNAEVVRLFSAFE